MDQMGCLVKWRSKNFICLLILTIYRLKIKQLYGTYSPWTYLPLHSKLFHIMQKKNTSKQSVYLKKIGLNIRQARAKKEISQESLALIADLDRSYVGGVERGERNISVINLKKLAVALKVPVSQLLKDL